MNVFAAMVVDSYRELNSKKLFWIILGISGVIVLFFGSIGFGDTGMSYFYGLLSVENEYLTYGSPMSVMLYRSIFSTFIVGVWLAWAATILALISTTSIFPDFLAGGAVEIVLSKPIGRVQLFAMKYLVSLLFVLLQVTVFCAGIFLCLGLRLGDWEWRVFLAVPVVTTFYSYLFSVNVLVGVWTRSALAALLATLLFWFSLFGANLTEGIFAQRRAQFELQVEAMQQLTPTLEARLQELEGRDDPATEALRARLAEDLEANREQRDSLVGVLDSLAWWNRLFATIQAFMPKPAETIALLDRWLRRSTDINILDIMAGNVTQDESGNFVTTDQSRQREAQRRLEKQYSAKSEAYLVGTSLLFEAGVLVLACVIFVRRDY